MKFCFMCDLHLPRIMSALQYDALEWALADAVRKKADCVIFAGDITCDGNYTTYFNFTRRVAKLPMPVIYIPGNSDLRDPRFCDIIKNMSSPCMTKYGDVTVFALNDCDKTIAEGDIDLLAHADKNSIVFMHHPIKSHNDAACVRLEEFVHDNPDAMVFYAHKHISVIEGNTVALQALDPDKAMGEYPCITYYDTATRAFEKAYYFAPVPADFYDNLGVSCYRTSDDIEFAINHRLPNLELRNKIVLEDENRLLDLVCRWRRAGGKNLSVHLTDVSYDNGKAVASNEYHKLISLAKKLGANRLTQHAPRISVNTVSAHPDALDSIAKYIADAIGNDHPFVIGIENLHLTKNDDVNIDRRFGCTPEECLQFMKLVASHTDFKVGINLDIGHARNNSPISTRYQVGTWYTMLGKYVVGYHFHQVSRDGENHTPITQLHGGIINFTSFFKNWMRENINKAPVIMEMRPENSYEVSLDTFDKYKLEVFDLHSHTYYSRCGRDDPEKLVKTAIENGISTLGISDHAHGIGDRFDSYLWHLGTVAQKYKDKIKLVYGVEIATDKKLFDKTLPERIGMFDYCLIEHITDPESGVGGNLIDYCKRTGILCGIAHTDLFEYCDMYGYDYADYFKQLADNGIFWEMNVNYDSIHKYNKHKYVRDFMTDSKKLEIVKSSGLKLSIGFDSHRCEDYYAPAVYDMFVFLKQNGINTVI